MRRGAGRAVAIGSAIAVVGLLGLILSWLPGRGFEFEASREPSPGSVRADETANQRLLSEPRDELERRFEQAAVMLHAARFEYALAALDRVLELAPGMPEAHVNRGFALLGLGEAEHARRSFDRALALRPTQTNAYYGLAVAHDEVGDRPAALGAMRTFVHLSSPDDLFVRKARAALWEWQADAAEAVEP